MSSVRLRDLAVTACGTCGDDVTRAACRVCGKTDMSSVLCLGRVPLANDFRPVDAFPAEHHPLHLMHCDTCRLAQLARSVPPQELFDEYAYFSSASDPVVAHGAELRRFVARTVASDPLGLIVDVGSNDGYLLQGYAEGGHRVLGIDPARNVAEIARAKGVPTVAAYFSAALAEELRAQHGPASVIHANNVLAHTPEVLDFLAGCRRLLETTNGRLIVEVPYLRDLIRGRRFDTIYHEHVYYFSVTALDRLFGAAGLTALRIDRLSVHGGSLRITAAAGSRARGTSVTDLLSQEAEEGVGDASYYNGFAADVHRFLRETREQVEAIAAQGHTIAGFGAPAKTAVMMSGARWPLSFVCDSTPYKQEKLVPGTGIPVVAPARLMTARPDYCFIFAWNYADTIVAAHRDYLASGGVFLVPENGDLRFIGS